MADSEKLDDIPETVEEAVDIITEPIAAVDTLASESIAAVIGKTDAIIAQLAAGDARGIALETKLDRLLGMLEEFPKASLEQIENVAEELETDANKVVDHVEPTPEPPEKKRGSMLMKRRKR